MRHTTRASRLRSILIATVTLGVVSALMAGTAAADWNPGVDTNSSSRSRADVAPLAPTSAGATCGGLIANTITVSWTAPARATNYTILQSTTSASAGFTPVATGVTGNQWTTARITLAATYWFRVQAYAGTQWVGGTSVTTNSRTITLALLCS